MCDFFLNALHDALPTNLWEALSKVNFDERGRCAMQHQLEKTGEVQLTPSAWPESRVKKLVLEVVDLMDKIVKKETKVKWLCKDAKVVGCVFPFCLDTIYIKPTLILHPCDVISTVLHELGHVFVHRMNHTVHAPSEDKMHCSAWKDAVRFLTVLFGVSFSLMN